MKNSISLFTIPRLCFAAISLSLLCASNYYFYPENPLPPSAQIDSIVVYKSQRKLLVYEKGRLLKAYTISLGRNQTGAKEFEGDKKKPKDFTLSTTKTPTAATTKTWEYPTPIRRIESMPTA